MVEKMNLLSQLKSNNNIIIYGAGKIGHLIDQLCQENGINVSAIWDNNPDKVLEFPEKERISRPPKLSDGFGEHNTTETYPLFNALIIVTMFSADTAIKVADSLRAHGFKNILYERSEISSLLIDHCKTLSQNNQYEFDLDKCFICPARRDDHIECEIFNQQHGVIKKETDEFVSLPVMGFLLTTKCNLTCVGCNHLRDHFDKEDNIDFSKDNILSDLRKLLDAVDFIKSIVIVGGEAFMHPDFETILKKVLSFPKIGFVQIISNGTVMPKGDSVFELLSNSRVVVEISGYGEKPGSARVKKRDKFIKKLSEKGIRFRYDEAAQWFDFGGFHKRSLTTEEFETNYKNCCFVSNDLFNGQLHKCSRSAYGLYLNKINNYENDYVDIRSTETNRLRKNIKDFIKMRPMACYHCNGTTGKTIPAGVQVLKKA